MAAQTEGYTASAIQILDSHQSNRFLFIRIDSIANRYPSVAIEFIERLLTACQLSGFDEALAIRRYLDRDRSIAVTPEFLACHRDLIDERHRPRRQST